MLSLVLQGVQCVDGESSAKACSMHCEFNWGGVDSIANHHLTTRDSYSSRVFPFRCPPIHLYAKSTPDVRQAPFWHLMFAWRFAIFLAVLIPVIAMRWRFHRDSRNGWSATLAFFNSFYIYFILKGGLYIFQGIWRIVLLDDRDTGPARILSGVLNMAPFLAILMYGRHKLFKLMERRFEDTRRGFDSALIAQLMDSDDIQLGKERWVHHGKNFSDAYPDIFDHRRNWTCGVVAEVHSDKYAVNLNVGELVLDITDNPRSCPLPLEWISLPDSCKLEAAALLKFATDNLQLLDGLYLTAALVEK